jgi:N-acetyl sugar amidotransferase
MPYCSRCVYPATGAAAATFDENGVCSGCRVADQMEYLDWDKRWRDFVAITGQYRSESNYDILVPVSGGKDSYFQVHVAKSLGLKPLLVTYHGNNYLPEGSYNLERMREVFDCDHIIVRPSTDVLIKMNRIGFRLQGDMNWHAHCGIFTVPIQMAVRYRVPLILWGEHGFMDLGGMYSYRDYVEFTAKFRKEHALRGYDWYDFTDAGLAKLGQSELREGLTDRDLLWAQYPSDDEIDAAGVRGIYLSNFQRWDANEHVKLVIEKYGWRPAQHPFARTYRRMSNLDDMHENGIHDYLKFVKLGYGRGTDHSCKDIRAGLITREQGIANVRRFDHVKPRRDLERWLDYVDMTEEEFDGICDTFRDPRVWRVEAGRWVKETIWGERADFGPVLVAPSDTSRHRPTSDRELTQVEHDGSPATSEPVVQRIAP